MHFDHRRAILCTFAVLQFVAASGHVLHHALHPADVESGCSCRHDGSAADCHFGGPAPHQDADRESPHDCQGCLLCDATTTKAVPGSLQPSRPVEDCAAPPALAASCGADVPAAVALLPASLPASPPNALHSFTLPLLI